MRKTIFIVSAIILAVSVNSCKSKKTVENSSPEQTQTRNVAMNDALVEKYWKLYEIFGTNLKDLPDLPQNAYITLKADENRVIGNGSCNSFTGTYELKPGNGIQFSSMAATMMMCMNMDVETKMMQVLEMADSYYVKNDTLILNKARMAPLARFEAVYLK